MEKLSDIVHMKRSLTTRPLRQNGRFANSSTLCQKVINYLVKCLSYAIAQNKANQQEIQKAISCIVPHAFGNPQTATLLGVDVKIIPSATSTMQDSPIW